MAGPRAGKDHPKPRKGASLYMAWYPDMYDGDPDEEDYEDEEE